MFPSPGGKCEFKSASEVGHALRPPSGQLSASFTAQRNLSVRTVTARTHARTHIKTSFIHSNTQPRAHVVLPGGQLHSGDVCLAVRTLT